jgi:hypothetical protein
LAVTTSGDGPQGAAFKVGHDLGCPVPSAITDDECYIDLPVFQRFLIAFIERHNGSAHYIERSLIGGVLGISYVLVERAGGRLRETDPGQRQHGPSCAVNTHDQCLSDSQPENFDVVNGQGFAGQKA